MSNNIQQKTSNPINRFINILLKSNPQAKQILNMLNGTTSEDAKSKILNMAQNGQINQQQLNQFINFAKQMGLNDQQINELNQITFKKGNRW